MRQSNFLCLFTVFKLKSSYCQHRLQSEGPLVRSYRTVRLKTRSKILRLMSFNWKRSCQHRLSPTSPLWNHPPPSSFSAFLEPGGAQGINYPLKKSQLTGRFGRGRSAEIFDWVFSGALFTLRYFQVVQVSLLPVLPQIPGIT